MSENASGITNYRRIESTVACAGAITVDAVAGIRDMGYASIINLRLATEPGVDVDAYRAAAAEAGIRYFHIPFSTQSPDPAALDAFLRVIRAPDTTPAFIH